MRTILFKKKGWHWTDPVTVGDIIRIRKGNKWYTAIVANEVEPESCEGCLFYDYDDCNAPIVPGSASTLCSNAGCVFKDLNKVMEGL